MESVMLRTILVFLLTLFSGSAQAEITDWLSQRDTERFIQSKLSAGKGYYPTAIECGQNRGKIYFRFVYSALDGPKPFYKWQWVHGEAHKLAELVSKIPLTQGRPELKYVIVAQDTYKMADGKLWGCAIAYR